MSSPARVLADWLVGGGYATRPAAAGAWPLAVGEEPGDPDNCLTLYDTAGIQSPRVMRKPSDGPQQVIHHGVQLRIRSSGSQTGWDKGNVIVTALSELKREYVTTQAPESKDYMIVAVTLTSPLVQFGKQEKNARRLHSANFLVTIQEL